MAKKSERTKKAERTKKQRGQKLQRGNNVCPGVPVELALLSILAAFGVAFGVTTTFNPQNLSRNNTSERLRSKLNKLPFNLCFFGEVSFLKPCLTAKIERGYVELA